MEGEQGEGKTQQYYDPHRGVFWEGAVAIRVEILFGGLLRNHDGRRSKDCRVPC